MAQSCDVDDHCDGRALGLSRMFPPPRQIDYSDREWYRAHRSGRGVYSSLTPLGTQLVDYLNARDYPAVQGLVTFFAIVAVIHQQELFKPVIDAVLAQDPPSEE